MILDCMDLSPRCDPASDASLGTSISISASPVAEPTLRSRGRDRVAARACNLMGEASYLPA
jgi:hypothetical protein